MAQASSGSPGVASYPPDQMWRTRFIDYFAVCGLGLDLRTLEGERGFQGLEGGRDSEAYYPVIVDRYPAEDYKKFEVPEMLALAVLPGGLKFHPKGASAEVPDSMPRSYPIFLTEANGASVYVAVLAFRDLVDEDVAQAYSIPSNLHVDKCLCIVSHWPFLDTFQAMLEELHRITFQPGGCPRPVWDLVASWLTVPLPPSPGSTFLFSFQDDVYSVTLPAENSLPFASFLPLVESLDVHNIVKLFTAVLLEKRILLLAKKYKLLSLTAKALTAIIYPYKWMLPFIPVLPIPLLELLHAPGIFIYGINTADVDVDYDELDGVVIADLDKNQVKVTQSMDGGYGPAEFIPELPDPEYSELHATLQALIHPYLVTMESVPHARPKRDHEDKGLLLARAEPAWGREHDERFRLAFIGFFASILRGYKDFVMEDMFVPGKHVFVKPDFMLMRSERRTKQASMAGWDHSAAELSHDDNDTVLEEMLSTNGWNTFFESQMSKGLNTPSLFDTFVVSLVCKEPLSIPPPPPMTEFVTLSEQALNLVTAQTRRVQSRLTYVRFPAGEKSAAQESKSVFKEKAMRAWLKERKLGNSKSSLIRGAELEMKVFDTTVRLCQHFDELREVPATESPTSSEHYGTIFGILDSDVDGISSGCFLECLKSSIGDHWSGELDPPHFMACTELALLAVTKSVDRKDSALVGQYLEVSGRIYTRDNTGLKHFLRRYLGSLGIWKSKRLWEDLFEQRIKSMGDDSVNNFSYVVLTILEACAFDMAELGIEDEVAWPMLLELAISNGIKEKIQAALRAFLALLQLKFSYLSRLSALSIAVSTGPSLIPKAAPAPPQSPVRSIADAARLLKLPKSGSEGSSGGGAGEGGGPTTPGAGGPSPKPGEKAKLRAGGALRRFKAVGKLAALASRSHEASKPEDGATKKALMKLPSRKVVAPGAKDNPVAPEAPAAGTDNPVRLLGGKRWASRRAKQLQRESQGLRELRGHRQSSVTALHAGCNSELLGLLDGCNDKGYFVSGAADGTVKLWNPEKVGAEMRATYRGNTGPIKSITTDEGHVVSASEDGSVLLFEKRTSLMLGKLGLHTLPVSSVRMLAGPCRGSVATAGWDGRILVWDLRAHDKPVTTVTDAGEPGVLCLSHCTDGASLLAAGRVDGTALVWDLVAGRARHVLEGHTNWVNMVKVYSDLVLTGSTDWTARVFSTESGECQQALVGHAGAVTDVDHFPDLKDVIATSSVDGTARLWKQKNGLYESEQVCHEDPNKRDALLMVRLGNEIVATGACNNTLSFYQYEELDDIFMEKDAQSKPASWLMLKTLDDAPDMVRKVALDMETGKMCTGAHSGVIRIWNAFPEQQEDLLDTDNIIRGLQYHSPSVVVAP